MSDDIDHDVRAYEIFVLALKENIITKTYFRLQGIPQMPHNPAGVTQFINACTVNIYKAIEMQIYGFRQSAYIHTLNYYCCAYMVETKPHVDVG